MKSTGTEVIGFGHKVFICTRILCRYFYLIRCCIRILHCMCPVYKFLRNHNTVFSHIENFFIGILAPKRIFRLTAVKSHTLKCTFQSMSITIGNQSVCIRIKLSFREIFKLFILFKRCNDSLNILSVAAVTLIYRIVNFFFNFSDAIEH